MEKDRYEWERYHCSFATKEIFIRDIYKSWYVQGINSRVDTIDKLVGFLKEEIGVFPVILVGSSSGGYLASILGYLLNASYVIAFSAQFELRNQWAKEKNPFLRKYEYDKNRKKYYDLKGWLENSSVPIYYIVPIKCPQDKYHYDYIKGVSCVHPLVFNSKHHGVVIPKCCLNKFISLDEKHIELLFQDTEGKILSPIIFSIHFVGLITTIKDLTKTMLYKFKIMRK